MQTEILKPDKLDATVSLHGPQFIDVSASAQRDYELSFHTYKEGQYNAKVWAATQSCESIFQVLSPVNPRTPLTR